MELVKPAGLTETFALDATKAPSDICELAKGNWNGSKRAKRAYQALTFVMAVALAVGGIYAVVSFKDDESAKGFIGLLTTVGALLTTGVFGKLAKSASDDEKAMWDRAVEACKVTTPAA
jgi:hypothetical protein